MGGEEGGAGEGGISKLTKTQCSEGRGKTGILYLHFEKKKKQGGKLERRRRGRNRNEKSS